MTRRMCIDTVSTDLHVGKTTMRIFVNGCVRCGATRSSDYHTDHFVEVRVGKRRHQVEMRCCDECQRAKAPGLFV